MKYSFAWRPTLCLLTLLLVCQAIPAQAKRRDHLNEAEADRVREAQIIDERTKVFIKAAERRFLALTNPSAATSKEALKDAEKWGAWPVGTRGELLGDLAGLLDEAINNIDGVAESHPNEKLLPKALRALATACQRWQPVLLNLRAQAQPAEKQPLEEALEYIESILQAGRQLPPEEKGKNAKTDH